MTNMTNQSALTEKINIKSDNFSLTFNEIIDGVVYFELENQTTQKV